MDRKDWNRIGIVAAVLLVPGGFLLGGAISARRYRQRQADATGPAAAQPASTEPADTARR